uniref:threonine/serine dehydratase n=1 Tax=unclassified Variovorax TaxID=663243 RepID=UPI000D37C4B1
MQDDTLPDLELDDIRATAAALEGAVLRTPVAPLHGHTVQRLLGTHDTWMKLELFQHTGSFKARGALNVARQLTPAQRDKGITAVSAGNHAIAAAFAAQQAGVSAKIVVQATANPARVALARAYGAELLTAPDGAAGFAMVEALMRDEGRTFIHPFEGRFTSLGAATLGLEFGEQVPDMDAVIVAVGGGGLASGVATAIRKLLPKARVFGVEPEGADVMRRSFEAGAPQHMAKPTSVADSLAPPMTTPTAYGLCRRHIERMVTVSDDEICRALAVLFRDAKLAVEPAGAAALAALLGPLRDELRGAKVGLIVCGANMDAAGYGQLLARGEQQLG